MFRVTKVFLTLQTKVCEDALRSLRVKINFHSLACTIFASLIGYKESTRRVIAIIMRYTRLHHFCIIITI